MFGVSFFDIGFSLYFSNGAVKGLGAYLDPNHSVVLFHFESPSYKLGRKLSRAISVIHDRGSPTNVVRCRGAIKDASLEALRRRLPTVLPFSADSLKREAGPVATLLLPPGFLPLATQPA